MAQANISSVKNILTQKVGAKLFVIGEIMFPTGEYKTEGCEISEKQLQELGLTLALVEAAWVLTSQTAAKAVKAPHLQFNLTKPNEAGQKVKVQAYESVTTELDKELAAESAKLGAATAIVCLVGR